MRLSWEESGRCRTWSVPGAGVAWASGTARPNKRVSAANGFCSRLRRNDAAMFVRYGLNSAVSLSVLPKKSEYVLEKSKPGKRSERSE